MNAYKIMLFLLLLNLSISAVTSLSIYSTAGNVDAPEEYNVSYYQYSSFNVIMDFVGWDLIASLITGAVAGVFLAYGLKVPGDSAFVYSTFSVFYLAKTQDTLRIFWSMGETASADVQTAILTGCVIFSFVVVVALLSFIMQLVKGPWATMD